MQPAASAGPIFRVAIAAGKFHGVIMKLTPTGCRCTMIRLAPDGATDRCPSIRTASSAYQRKNSAAYRISPRASRSALPFSSTISRASCSDRSVISSKARRRHSPRCRGGVAAQPGSAAAAASTAASPSSGLASATSVIASSVAGLITASVPARPDDHWPPISSPVGASMPVMSARSLSRCRLPRCPPARMRGPPPRSPQHEPTRRLHRRRQLSHRPLSRRYLGLQ